MTSGWRHRRRGVRAACVATAILVSLVWVYRASQAEAAPAYAFIGTGDAAARTGALSGEVRIDQAPGALAVRADGVIAFTSDADGRAYWSERGRLTRLSMPATVEMHLDVAFARDGALYVSTCDGFGDDGRVGVPPAVWKIGPGRRPERFAGRPGRPGTAGDGGPATAARLECPTAIDAQADGGLLIADSGANRIRRVGPDGVIRTVAGNGREASDGDGGPAASASVQPLDVAALPGGGFAIADLGPNALDAMGVKTDEKSIVRVVDAAGTITTRSQAHVSRIAAEPSGALLMTHSGRQDVRRLEANGTVATVVDSRRETLGMPTRIPIAGDPFGNDQHDPYDAAAFPDGGVLYAGSLNDATVNYVPPTSPSLLAVALRPATRRPARRLSLALRTTLAARIHVGVWRRGRRAASATALVPGGDATVPVPQTLQPGLYNVRVRAEGAGQLAAARADVLVGGRLPVSFARSFIRSRQELFRVFNDAPRARVRCRRIASRRVDCGIVQRRRCSAVATIRVQRDGTLAVAQYDGGHRRRCRFRR